MNESPGFCPFCDYNLKGLPSQICPECGHSFAPQDRLPDSEFSREGTPVYRVPNSIVLRTVQTVLMMMFTPRAFATRLRVDEPMFPSVMALLVSASCFYLKPLLAGYANADSLLRLLIANLLGFLLVFTAALLISALSLRGQSQRWRFPDRLKFWCMTLMYSMAFAPLTAVFATGPWKLEWAEYTRYWPLFDRYFRTNEWIAMGFLLWWTMILAVVLWHRCKPKWMAAPLLLVALAFARCSLQLVEASIPRLTQ